MFPSHDIELKKQLSDLTIAETNAQKDLQNANYDAAKVKREIQRDLFEQELDNILDVYDRNKTVNEQQLQDDSLNANQKVEILNKIKDADIRNQQEIQDLYEKQTGKKIDLNELLKVDNVATLNDIMKNTFKFDEIERNRLREIYVERRQYGQDLIALEKELQKERTKSTEIQSIEAKNYKLTAEENKKIQDKSISDLEKRTQLALAKQEQDKKDAETEKSTRQEIANQAVALGNEVFNIGQVQRENEMQDIEKKRNYELSLAKDNKEKQDQINKKYDSGRAIVTGKQIGRAHV